MRQLDLDDLAKGRPRLTAARAAGFAQAAAVTFETNGHASGVAMPTDGVAEETLGVTWTPTDEATRSTWADPQEATEHGAYGVGLLLAEQLLALTVVERSFKYTGFDYWLGPISPETFLFQGKTKLEVSGIGEGGYNHRTRSAEVGAGRKVRPGRHGACVYCRRGFSGTRGAVGETMSATSIDLHDAAMNFAEEAMAARRAGDETAANNLFRQAFSREREAADLVEAADSLEPTRSILLRSAASLALQANELREAERLVARGLGGNPPDDVADELRDLLEQINFERHLDLRGIELEKHEFQLSMSGNSVGFGVTDSKEFLSRVDIVQKLVYRTAERKRGEPYREKGLPKDKDTRDLEVFMSVPRAASFAVTLRLGAPEQMSLPGSQQEQFVSSVIDELLKCLRLFDAADVQAIHQKIPDNAYYRNFMALAKAFAPDGSNVKIVGLTSTRDASTERVLLKTPRPKAPRVSPASPRGGKTLEIVGTLKFADDTQQSGRIQLIDDTGKKHKIIVPEGMMADIVRPMWDTTVSVSAHKTLRGLVLDDITPVQT
ncbi:MAG TPA: hypothetical protein VNI54_08705 [Thermoanaerobaculia bacterium]|nr:hypothetical protein [Thermoanaerobaculia bacterium]